jgi:replicative DNA helicase
MLNQKQKLIMSKAVTELEKNVLGALMGGSNYIEEVLDEISPEIFPSFNGKLISEAIIKLYNADKAVDVLTLFKQLQSMGKPYSAITPVEVSNISQDIFGIGNLQVWVKILQQDYARLQYQILGEKMLNIGRNQEIDIVEERENIENLLVDLDSKIFNVKEESMLDTLEQMKLDNDELLLSDKSIRGVNTGIQKLNDLTSGWKEGQLIILGAASGGGKSALSTSFAISSALVDAPTHFITIEMTRKEVLLRAASNMSGVKHESLDRNGVDNEQRQMYFNALDRISQAPLFVDDSTIKNLTDLKFKIKKRIRTHGTRLVIVDYIQIVNNSNNKANREQQVNEISRVLKEVAREFKISVIGLTQMNREHDGKNEPYNHMIRESSGLEHNADVILFLYDPEEEPHNVLKVSKNRGGEKDKYIALHWEKQTFKFIEQ